MLDIDPKHLLQVTSPDNEEPVKALGADRANPALGIRVRSGRPDGCEQHLGAFGAEHVVEAAAELRITVAEHEAYLSSPVRKHQQQVAGLLGHPLPGWMRRHPGHMDPPGVQFDKEQDVQPPQPDSVDGEEVARDDPGGLLA